MLSLPYLLLSYTRTDHGGVVEYTCRDCHRTITLLLPHDGEDVLKQQVLWLAGSCQNTRCQVFKHADQPDQLVETLVREVEGVMACVNRVPKRDAPVDG